MDPVPFLGGEADGACIDLIPCAGTECTIGSRLAVALGKVWPSRQLVRVKGGSVAQGTESFTINAGALSQQRALEGHCRGDLRRFP